MAKRIFLLSLAYFAAGWFGLQIPYTGTHITLVWLPTGVALAALLRWGFSVWPGIYLGAFLVNLVIGSTPPLAAGIAIGNTLGPIVAAMWLQRFGFHTALDRQKDAGLLIVASCLGMAVSASGGIGNLYLFGLLPAASAGMAWLTWWMGDCVGLLLAAPLLLTLSRKSIQQLTSAPTELAYWMLIAGPIAWLAFVQDYLQLGRTLPLAFMTLPLIAWAALRFGITAAGLSGLFFSVLAAWSTASGRGAFFVGDENIGLLLLWIYMATTVLTGLIIGALRAERQQIEDALRESGETYRVLFESSTDALSIIDPETGHFIDCNAAAVCIHGTATRAAFIAATAEDLSPPRQPDGGLSKDLMLEHIQKALAEGSHTFEWEYGRLDGSTFPALVSLCLLPLKGRKHLLAIGRDITDQKRAEAEMLMAKRAAESANQAKSAFLATMSHEIRTPLNGILGMAQILMMPNIQEDERFDYAQIINNSGQGLLTILNDILDLSKIEAGRIVLEELVFTPAQLFHEVETLFAEQALAKGLALELAWKGLPEARYRGDPSRLRQMLSNLLGNAIKFTATGFIRIEGQELEGTNEEVTLEFAVTDSGIGIPENKQTLLFQPFTQVDASTTREYGGTGLGLSIVRKLARLMGGDVGLESEEGKGTRIWFHFQAGRVLPGGESRQTPHIMDETEASTLALSPSAVCSVLIVEDNATNRVVIESILRKMAIPFESVGNGQEAIERLKAGMSPDLVLMDCQMPVMDGYEATQHIRQLEREGGKPHLPVIALTASAYEEDRIRCMNAGMDDFLTKPVNMGSLQTVLNKWLSS